MQFKDLPLLDFGHKIMASGIIYTDGGLEYKLYFPNEESNVDCEFYPTVEEWEALLKQTDDVMVQTNRKDPLVRAYIKKSQRNIDQTICWKVYARDHYTCRYCGRTGLPLTVDHIDLWEDGGITTEDNLNTSCKQCNRNRGNMKYEQWLHSAMYNVHNHHLPETIKQLNLNIVETLPELEKRRVNYQRAKR